MQTTTTSADRRRMRKSDVLAYIQGHPGCTLEEAARDGAANGAGSQLVAELAQDGWLRIAIDPDGLARLSARTYPAMGPQDAVGETTEDEHLRVLVDEARDQAIDPKRHVMHVVAGNMDAGSMDAGYASRLLMTAVERL